METKPLSTRGWHGPGSLSTQGHSEQGPWGYDPPVLPHPRSPRSGPTFSRQHLRGPGPPCFTLKPPPAYRTRRKMQVVRGPRFSSLCSPGPSPVPPSSVSSEQKVPTHLGWTPLQSPDTLCATPNLFPNAVPSGVKVSWSLVSTRDTPPQPSFLAQGTLRLPLQAPSAPLSSLNPLPNCSSALSWFSQQSRLQRGSISDSELVLTPLAAPRRSTQ